MRSVFTTTRYAHAIVLALGCGFAACADSGDEIGSDVAAVAANPGNNEMKLLLPPGIPAERIALLAAGTLRLGDYVGVVGSAAGPAAVANLAGSATELGKGAHVGTLWSQPKVTLRNDALVDGDLYTTTSVEYGVGANATGKKDLQAKLSPAQELKWNVTVPSGSFSDRNVEGTPPAFAPGNYGRTSVKPNATLVLRSGSYYFGSLSLETGSTLVLDDSAGPIVVTTVSGFTFRGKIIAPRGAFPDFVVQVAGSDDVILEGAFRGTVVAPKSNVKLGTTSVAHEGSFYGRNIQCDANAHIVHHPFSLDALRPGGKTGLTPVAECIQPTGHGSYLGVFGYRNTAASPATIPTGDSNRMVGATSPEIPTTFLSGRHRNAFAVTFTESATWTLDGMTSKLTPQSAMCPAQQFAPMADTTAQAAEPDRNLGSQADLVVDAGKVALLEFDAKAIKRSLGTGRFVTKATLVLHVTSGSPSGLELRQVSRPWTERATWNCEDDTNVANSTRDCQPDRGWKLGPADAPPYNPWRDRPARDAVTQERQGSELRIDVTADVNRILYPMAETHGWVLRMNAGNVVFGSRESAQPPQLILETVSRDTSTPGVPAPLEFVVDSTLVPSRPALDPIGTGLAPRPVGVLVAPDGIPTEFVTNEMMLLTSDAGELSSFLSRWNGTVLDSHDLVSMPGLRLHAIQVDLSRARPENALPYLAELDNRPRGKHRVSNEDALRLLAIAAEAKASGVPMQINWLGQTTSQDPFLAKQFTEGPDETNHAIGSNPATWPHMSVGSAQNIGVVEGWRLLRLMGKLKHSIPVAIADSGFWKDADYPEGTRSWGLDREPFAIGDKGSTADWHGTFVATAGFGQVNNGKSGAGPGGPVSILSTYNQNLGALDTVVALDLAGKNGKIVSSSVQIVLPAISAMFSDIIQSTVDAIHSRGTLLFASAGNDGADVNEEDCFGVCWEKRAFLPCESGRSICVGGLQHDSTEADSGSNWGSDIDIWGPFHVFLDKTPGETDGMVHINGTSYSTPFVAGVAAMIWAADPSASSATVANALFSTASVPLAASRVNRIVNAYQAVKKRALDLGPASWSATVEIASPTEEMACAYGTPMALSADAFGLVPALGGGFSEAFDLPVSWTVETFGDPSTQTSLFSGSSGSALAPGLGRYTVRASITGADGQVASDAVSINTTNVPPTIATIWPLTARNEIRGRDGIATTMTVSATDVNEGTLPCDRIAWATTYGDFATAERTGCRQTITFDGSRPKEPLFITVTDSQGEAATYAYGVFLEPFEKSLPLVAVVSPGAGYAQVFSRPFPLEGAVLHVPDGRTIVHHQWAWQGDADGLPTVLEDGPGPGTPFSWIPGDHFWSVVDQFGVIRYTVTDSANKTAVSEVRTTILGQIQ